MSEKATLALTGHDSESPEPAAKKARCSKDCEDSAWRLPESRGLSGSFKASVFSSLAQHLLSDWLQHIKGGGSDGDPMGARYVSVSEIPTNHPPRSRKGRMMNPPPSSWVSLLPQ